MKIGTVLVATDLNQLYMQFIPSFVTAWKAVLPEADVCVVLIADRLPPALGRFADHIRLFKPIPGVHTAFQAQCIRLLYPRFITRNEGVLITDMDMLPMNRSYYVDHIAEIPNDHFVVYRDVCLPGEISMCYNVAHPQTWTSMFGTESNETMLVKWNSKVRYSGEHGGSGWNTDQIILVNAFNAWNGPKKILNDTITKYNRLDRAYPQIFDNPSYLRALIKQGVFSDYHCLRPYAQYKTQNDFVVESINRW
jgi:hypothetical protein